MSLRMSLPLLKYKTSYLQTMWRVGSYQTLADRSLYYGLSWVCTPLKSLGLELGSAQELESKQVRSLSLCQGLSPWLTEHVAFSHGVTNPSSTYRVDDESESVQLALGTLTSWAYPLWLYKGIQLERHWSLSAGNRLLVISLQGKTQWLSPLVTKGMIDRHGW